MLYQTNLEATKQFYPFAEWEKNFYPDPEDKESGIKEQHSPDNCKRAKDVFDKLIGDLIAIGKDAKEKDKTELFKIAILSLNMLDNEIDNFILTGEREDLCDLFDRITIAAELDPKNYANGDGIADQWREW